MLLDVPHWNDKVYTHRTLSSLHEWRRHDDRFPPCNSVSHCVIKNTGQVMGTALLPPSVESTGLSQLSLFITLPDILKPAWTYRKEID